MNPTLQLKGKFNHKNNENKPGPKNIPKGKKVESRHLLALIDQLRSIGVYWQKEKTIGGVLLSVYYIDVIAKSNRISSLFKKGKITANSTIRGSRFEGNPQKHVTCSRHQNHRKNTEKSADKRPAAELSEITGPAVAVSQPEIKGNARNETDCQCKNQDYHGMK